LAEFSTERTHAGEIPHTATGKIQKITLRQQFKDYRLPGVQAAE
jgi:acyl-coenzyme A synthetase/AMP-(fatty) acid ligase